MIDLGCEGDLGGLEGVVRWEEDGEVEHSARVRAVGRSQNGCRPSVDVVCVFWTRRTVGGRVRLELLQFLENALGG
jgi:hypothetical protein